eukprot:919480-Heterocapsa_arctica.AAC.1
MGSSPTQEDMEGNKAADKLATQGVEMHEVPVHQVEEVQAQDKLVKDLLTMLLSVMKGVHDKAPVRKKEDRKAGTDGRQFWFHGLKVGAHGAHFFGDRE